MVDSLILPKLGRHKVSSVTRRDLENLHRQLKPTPYQANRVLALLSKMFSLAQEWGWSDRNPTRGIPKYQEQKRTRWLSPKELSRLLPVLDHQRVDDGLLDWIIECGLALMEERAEASRDKAAQAGVRRRIQPP